MTILDWLTLATYLVVVLIIGFIAGRKQTTADDLYVGGRRMPTWAVGVSVLATSVSGVTFIGGPQASYAGNLTYLATSIGTVLGMVLVAWLFVPKLHASRTGTIYGTIGERVGGLGRKACAVTFLGGRLLASGVRLYVAAIPCSLVLFGNDAGTGGLLASVAVLSTVAIAYASYGGIRAVIYTDALQASVLVLAVVASILVLSGQIPISFGESADVLAAAKDAGGNGKLTLFDWRMDVTDPFSMWAILTGFVLISAGAYGTDHDLAQRLLTAKSPRSASLALVASSILGVGVTALFLAVGLMLFVRDDTLGIAGDEDTRRVYLSFILSDLPIGLRGLIVAGLFAAAMSSLDSALNAMSSSIVLDFGHKGEHSARIARLGNIGCGVALAVTAAVFALADAGREAGIIPLALGVMIYAYAGLLGVFVSVLLLGRGSSMSVLLALISGAATVLAMEHLPAMAELPTPSLGWRMTVGFIVSLVVCVSQPSPPRAGDIEVALAEEVQ